MADATSITKPNCIRWCNSSIISMDWRWIVAISAFWMNLCIHGVMRTNAVVYVALLDNFPVNREEAAWFIGVSGFCMCITGVLSGYLNQYYSVRSIMMVGALTASVAVCLSSCATSIDHVTALYGACQGAGIGVVVPLTHVILNQHFTSNRALAMGIAYSGSSIGSFLFPPLANWLLGEFGISGMFMLLGGVMLNSLPAIGLMKSPPKLAEQNDEAITSIPLKDRKKKTDVEADCEGDKGTANAPQHRDANDSGKEKFVDDSQQDSTQTDPEPKSKCRNVCKRSFASETNPVTLPEDDSKCGIFYRYLKRVRSSFDVTFDILSNPHFIGISTTYAIYFSVAMIYLTVVLDFALDNGIPEKLAVYLISVFSFGDLVGRLGFGWIADLKVIRRRVIVFVYLLAMGGLVICIPWCYSFCLLISISLFLGLLNGSVMVNFSPMLAESIGLIKLPIALGFSSFIRGATAFFRPIVIGYFRDRNQSYDIMFIVLGVIQILIAMQLIFEELKHAVLRVTRASCWHKFSYHIRRNTQHTGG